MTKITFKIIFKILKEHFQENITANITKHRCRQYVLFDPPKFLCTVLMAFCEGREQSGDRCRTDREYPIVPGNFNQQEYQALD